MSKIQYTWDDVDVDVDTLYQQITASQWKPDVIVGIARGGVIPAVMLSHKMDIPFTSLEWSLRDSGIRNYDRLHQIVIGYDRILFVDDIVDSGDTVKSICNDVKYSYLNSVDFKIASLWYNTSLEIEVDYLATPINRNENDKWIVFPWEHDNA